MRPARGINVDNTFHHRSGPVQLWNIQHFIKEEGRFRQYNEFESCHHRRLLRQQEQTQHWDQLRDQRNRSRLGPGTGQGSFRPVTGVDLALGLNGCVHKGFADTGRMPCSLQPLTDEDESSRIRKRLARQEEQDDKWQRIQQELMARSQRKEPEPSPPAMPEEHPEEKSRQLEKSLIKDWEYQTQVKRVRERDARMEDLALDSMAEKESERIVERLKSLSVQGQYRAQAEREADLADRASRALRQEAGRVWDESVDKKQCVRQEELIRQRQEAELCHQKERAQLNQTLLARQIRMKEAVQQSERDHEVEQGRLANRNNCLVIQAQRKHQDQESKRRSAENRDGFVQYGNQMNEAKAVEQRESGLAFGEEQKNLSQQEYSNAVEKARKKRQLLQQHHQLITHQIREKAAAMDQEKEDLNRRQEDRLMDEAMERSRILGEREARLQQQRQYGQCLQEQIRQQRSRSQMPE